MVSISWRTGVNMREFAYYGTNVIDPNDSANTPALQETQLNALRDMNVKLVRFYASHHRFSTQDSIQRIRTALQKIGAAGMQAIVCLDDSVRDSGCFVPGNDSTFCPGGPHGHYLKQYYNDLLYNTHYMPHIEAIVTAFRNDPTVLIWELANEAALHPQHPHPPPVKFDFEAYFKFAQAASQKIKSIAPNHLVSTGFACVRHVLAFGEGDAKAHAQAERLYGLPTIDLISIHIYEEDGTQEATWREEWDLATANAVQKPFYLGEVGANNHAIDRVAYHEGRIKHWKDLGAFSVMPWQFNELSNDLKISDGMARMHPDFEALKAVVRSFGTNVGPVIISGVDMGTFGLVGRGSGEAGLDPNTREYRVNQAGPAIFAAPDPTGDKIAEGLVLDARLRVDPNSRLEKDGLVWWRASGWVVERPVDVAENAPEALLHFLKPPPRKLKMKVVFKGDINLRSDPSRPSPNPKANIVGEVKTNAIVEVYEESRTVTADGWIWWQHDDGHVEDKPEEKIKGGWSAESGDGKTFMIPVIEEVPIVIPDNGNRVGSISVEPFYQQPEETEINVNTLPLRDALFMQWPVDSGQTWILQPYGNTNFAFDACPYTTFFQGLHPGIDFGLNKNIRKSGLVEVKALVHGRVDEIITTSYQPYGVRITVGDYSVIFGHMDINDQRVKKNDLVTPETVLGHIANDDELAAYNALPNTKDINFWPHVHFEIRYLPTKPDRILNPLLFFTPPIRNQIIKKIDKKHFFDRPEIFAEWREPMRQPVIRWGKGEPKIGPLSVAKGGCEQL